MNEKLPVYALGHIPDDCAWAGQPLAFRIDAVGLTPASLAMRVADGPRPRGPALLDSGGVFRFAPEADDTEPLVVEFSAEVGGAPRTQRCTFSPVPLLKPEADQLVAPSTPPPRDDSLYRSITVRRHERPLAPGSAELVKNEEHVVTGMRLVFDSRDDANGLMAAYHSDRETKKLPDAATTGGRLERLVLVADEIEVRGELALPETNLVVFARRLVLRAQDGRPGCISTRPLAFQNARARPAAGHDQGADGHHGPKAGDVTLWVDELDAEGLCLDLAGGQGQGAGLGENGTNGTNNPTYTNSAQWGKLAYTFDPPAIHFRMSDRIWGTYGAEGDSYNWGSLVWPTDGGDAKKPGRPGNGGQGGMLQANVALARAASPRLQTALEALRADAKALADLVEHWVIHDLYGALKDKRYADMLARPSHASAQRVQAAIGRLIEAIAVVQQGAGAEGLPGLQAALAGAIAGLEPARRAGQEAAARFAAPDREWRADAPETREAAKALMHHAAALRTAVLALPRALNLSQEGQVLCHGGSAGEMATNVHGGAAGYPTDCADWEVRSYTDPIGGEHRSWQKIVTQKKTKPGDSFDAPAAQVPVGSDGALLLHAGPEHRHAWLHPLLLQTVLLYVRDAYLAAPQRADDLRVLLEPYRKALLARPPWAVHAALLADAGTPAAEPTLLQAEAEIGALLHRIASHLDYFGHPSGWTPLFSLAVSLRMYENELEHGLKALLLARWIGIKAASAREAAELAGEAITSLEAASEHTAAGLAAQQAAIGELQAQAASLAQETAELMAKIGAKRSELRDKAEADARLKAWVNLGVSTLAAVAQVIPYGQPALGTIASMGKTVASNVLNEADPVDTVGPLAGMLAGLAKSGLDAKAAAIVKEAAAKAKPDEKEDPAVTAAGRKADRLTAMGAALVPAVADVTSAIQGLTVPASEVDARLDKLAAECPELAGMVDEMRGFNERKQVFAEQLSGALQTLASGYAQITGSLLAADALERQRRQALEVLDPTALLHVRTMEQNARATLVKYLYLLAKSSEYATIQPVAVDYRLDTVVGRIAGLVDTQGARGPASLAKELEPLFRTQLHEIEKSALQHFDIEYENATEIRLSVAQTPALLRRLNEDGEVIVNLRELNCLWPGHEQVRIADVSVDDIDFGGARLPAAGTVEISFEPHGDGILRSAGALWVVRQPIGEADEAVPQRWGVRHHFGSGSREEIRPSAASLALLDRLLHDTPSASLERIAKPAAWTCVKVRYTRHVAAPDLQALGLRIRLGSRMAPRGMCSLDVRTEPGLMPLFRCSVPDVNGRDHGLGSIFRAYRGGQALTLTAPVGHGERAFSHWDVVDNTDTMRMRSVGGRVLHIERMQHDMIVHARFGTPLLLMMATGKRAPLPARRLFDAPDGVPIAALPPAERGTPLRATAPVKGWRKIDYRGTVGWIEAPGPEEEDPIQG